MTLSAKCTFFGVFSHTVPSILPMCIVIDDLDSSSVETISRFAFYICVLVADDLDPSSVETMSRFALYTRGCVRDSKALTVYRSSSTVAGPNRHCSTFGIRILLRTHAARS